MQQLIPLSGLLEYKFAKQIARCNNTQVRSLICVNSHTY